MKRLVLGAIVVALLLPGCSQAPPARVADGTATATASDRVIGRAFEAQQSGLQVEGSGVVERVLSDDNNGGRHQRFILRLASGQTLLMAHNIDVAPRVPSLCVGDTVSFSGVYEWNAEGGVIHWTHRDPAGNHQPGWLQHDGARYR